MSADIRSISVQNVSDVLRLMNESSRSTPLDFKLDIFGLLSYWDYWDFSQRYSVIQYVNQEAASIVIHCTDDNLSEVYGAYWGTLPKFRNLRIGTTLFETSCQNLRKAGYATFYGDSAPHRAPERYRCIKLQPEHSLRALETAVLNLPPVDSRYQIRPIDVSEIADMADSQEPRHWRQRISFLQRTAPFHRTFGAFDEDRMAAYIVTLSGPSGTLLIDLRSPISCLDAGYELLRYLVVNNHSAPFTANQVFVDSYFERLLTTTGFHTKHTFSELSRNLRETG